MKSCKHCLFGIRPTDDETLLCTRTGREMPFAATCDDEDARLQAMRKVRRKLWEYREKGVASPGVVDQLANCPLCGAQRERERLYGAAYWICPECHHPELIGEIYKEVDR